MAIDIKETIERTEQIDAITYDEFSDNLVFERIASDLNDPQLYFETGRAVEFSVALTRLLEKYKDLEEEKPDLYKRYQALVTLLELYGIPGFGPNKLQEIFQNHLLFAANHNIDLIDRINSLYLAYNFYPPSIRPLRNVILNALRDNKEILGQKNIMLNGAETKPYIGAWFLDYQLFGKEEKGHNPVDQSNYVMKSQNSSALDESQKIILLKLIRIYDYVLVPLLKKDYRPFDLDFHPNRHVESFLPEEETVGLKATKTEITAEPVADGLKITYGGQEINITGLEATKEKTEPEPREEALQREIKERVMVREREVTAPKLSAADQIQSKIRMKNNLFREDEEKIHKSEKEVLNLSDNDNDRIKDIILNAYLDKSADKFMAGLFLLARAGEIKSLIGEQKVKDVFEAEIFPLLLKQQDDLDPKEMAKDLEKNINDPVYVKIYLKFVISKIYSGEEEEAAFFATKLENIFASQNQEEYLGLAFYNISTDNYEWASVKVQENGKLAME